MSLVADCYTSSSSHSEISDSGSEDELNIKQRHTKKTTSNEIAITTKLTLPSANLVLDATSTAFKNKKGEVFNNPFQEAEKAKTALLEKHVKMVNKEEHITEKNGRKICWNNRKGRCRFGSNCHYAHDSDLNLAADMQPTVDKTNQNIVSSSAKKRKRPGISDSIQPGKRVIKAYRQQTQTLQKTYEAI